MGTAPVCTGCNEGVSLVAEVCTGCNEGVSLVADVCTGCYAGVSLVADTLQRVMHQVEKDRTVPSSL